jgi:hypothetical protein
LRKFVPYFGYTLTEIDLYSSIIHKRIVHFEIGLHRLFFRRELDERVLQRIAGIRISDYFCFDFFVKAGKDKL